MIVLAASVALARRGERTFSATSPVALKEQRAVAQHTTEGDALRDGQRVDPNRASAAELELLPGIGPQLARQIIAHRAAHGLFRSVDELRTVRGIGPKKLMKLRPLVQIASEELEHPAQAQRDVAGASYLSAFDEDAGADVDAERPDARPQVVGPKDKMAGREILEAVVPAADE